MGAPAPLKKRYFEWLFLTPSRYMSNEKINYDGLIRVEKPLYSSNDEQSDSDLNSNRSSEKYEQFNDENNQQNSSKSNHMQFTFRRREKNALEVNVVSTALPIELTYQVHPIWKTELNKIL